MSFDESKHVAFEGQKFRIEWYVDSSGESEALKYSEEMPKSHKAAFRAGPLPAISENLYH